MKVWASPHRTVHVCHTSINRDFAELVQRVNDGHQAGKNISKKFGILRSTVGQIPLLLFTGVLVQ